MSILVCKAFTLLFVVLPWQYVNFWLFGLWIMGNRFFLGGKEQNMFYSKARRPMPGQCQLWLPEHLCAFLQCCPDNIQIFASWIINKRPWYFYPHSKHHSEGKTPKDGNPWHRNPSHVPSSRRFTPLPSRPCYTSSFANKLLKKPGESKIKRNCGVSGFCVWTAQYSNAKSPYNFQQKSENPPPRKKAKHEFCKHLKSHLAQSNPTTIGMRNQKHSFLLKMINRIVFEKCISRTQ